MRADVIYLEDFKALPLDEQVEAYTKLYNFLTEASKEFGPSMKILYIKAQSLLCDINREFKFFKFLSNVYDKNNKPMLSSEELIKWLEQNNITDPNNMDSSLYTLIKLQVLK